MKTEVPKLTREQAAIVGIYTDTLCGDFEAYREKCQALLGRRMLTHEFGSRDLSAKLKELVKPEFLAICAD